MANVNSWQYARWTYIIGRTLRLTPGTTAETTAVRSFLTTELTERPWLKQYMYAKSTTGKGYDFAKESAYNLAKMVIVVGRDIKKQPLTANEKTAVDTLVTATGNRRYGAKGNLI